MAKSEASEIAIALAEALPRNGLVLTELKALGMVASALIAGTGQERRAELVELFCSTIRQSVTSELH